MPSPARPPDEPRISIIIATYEEAETIGGTVRAILSNITEPLEIIIVDDSPTPETARVVEQLGEARVRLIRRQGERGLASATVHGVAQARGEIVGWMDADAWMIPERLPSTMRAAPRPFPTGSPSSGRGFDMSCASWPSACALAGQAAAAQMEAPGLHLEAPEAL